MVDDILKDTLSKLHIINVEMRGGNFLVNESEDNLANLTTNNNTKTQSFRMLNQIRVINYENDDDSENVYEYLFTYSLGTRLIYASDEDVSDAGDFNPIVEIIGTFAARYRSNAKIEEEGLNSFAENNLCYHIWPYWREFMQSTCTRVGLNPVLSVPHYFVHKEHGENTQEA